ncbi:HET-domain-containing protein, partial [Setomelanomma holmii]
LSQCAKNHSVCRMTTHKFPIDAKVIDCHSRKVVAMKRHDRYLALSYVWGAQSANDGLSADSNQVTMDLSFLLPRTIDDAIFVTIKLGLRYLWCDRYCLEQYHSADKRHQINQMASVYNRAVTAICALGA